jgi:putative endonuclease
MFMMHETECGLPCLKCGEPCCYMDIACDEQHWCGCNPWYVYLLKCSDDTLYCGITNDLNARINKHNSGKGAKYTRGRTPVVLIKFWTFSTKGEALKFEYKVKQLSREEKLKL